MLQLKLLEEQEKANPQKTTRKEIIKISAQINEIETNKQTNIQRINETKSWFFENINKIERHLANLTEVRREKTHTVKSDMQKERQQQTPQKSRKSSETTLRAYTLRN
jgi:hypothetical protein